jgi:hypothetical protein
MNMNATTIHTLDLGTYDNFACNTHAYLWSEKRYYTMRNTFEEVLVAPQEANRTGTHTRGSSRIRCAIPPRMSIPH